MEGGMGMLSTYKSRRPRLRDVSMDAWICLSATILADVY